MLKTTLKFTLAIFILTSCSKNKIDTPPITTKNDGEVVDIDGNAYHTTKIGNQIWFVENLKVNHLNNGQAILNLKDSASWTKSKKPSYCYYNNDSVGNRIYGKLYNFYTVNTGKVCPTGWKVPSDSDWFKLLSFVGGENIAAGKLKVKTYKYWGAPNVGAVDSFGFSALPGGYRSYNSTHFYGRNIFGNWWSSKIIKQYYGGAPSTDDSLARSFTMYYDKANVINITNWFNNGLSIRCIKE
jgi:uncharacterized protein (TIGR02145 family)